LFLLKTWELGIEWRFSLYLQPYPHLQPWRQNLEQRSSILFLKYTPKLNAYPWKKKNAQIQSLYPQIWGLEIWSRKCFLPHPISTPHSHFQPPRKNVSAYVRPCGRTHASAQAEKNLKFNFYLFIIYFIFLPRPSGRSFITHGRNKNLSVDKTTSAG
jgi:hypothetical protein